MENDPSRLPGNPSVPRCRGGRLCPPGLGGSTRAAEDVGPLHGRLQRRAITDLDDGLQGRGQVPAVAGESDRARADPRMARRAVAIAAQLVIEASAAHALAQGQRLR